MFFGRARVRESQENHMRLMRLFPLLALASVLLSGISEMAASAQESATPRVRIVNRIDEGDLVTLRGNTHPAANARNDRGPVSPSLPMTDLILVLSRDKAQQAAFDKFVASQYDSASANFHQWLTPEQVGTNFGPSETDITTITNWLTGHGFTVTQIPKDHLSVRFNGTAAQVESAFHTQIHNLSVSGVPHVANMTDPELPAALSSVVVGVKALHNFFPRPLHRVGSPVTRDRATGKWVRSAKPATTAQSARTPLTAAPTAHEVPRVAAPQFGISITGTEPILEEDVGPYDFATIYNVLPLWNAKVPIDGTGQKIAIAGTSDIEVGQATTETGASGANDIATFRTFFGLPTGSAVNTPIRISGNSEPLTVCSSTTNTLCSTSDLLENTLDVEWSASVAKNAQIVLVASYPASTTDDNLYDSESYIVNHLTAHIMNVSYGECELDNGTAGNVQYYDLWQTAASEGIAVFVAGGDSGSASCDEGGDQGGTNVPYPAEFGLTVSGLASTPFDTVVGGTDFNWCSLTAAECTAAPYWSSTNNASAGQSSALGYLPEVPWNDTCTNPLALTFMENFWSGEVTVSDAEEACNAFTVNAETLSGQGDGTLLSLVDTVGGGGGASSCVVNSTTSTSTTLGACTSSASSTGATSNPETGAAQGSLTVVNNGWPKPSWQTGVTGIPTDGVRDIPDVSFFASDGFLSSSAYVVCASDLAACSFSSKGVPIFVEVGGTSVATPAMAGVMGLIDEKVGAAQGNPNAELYALAAKQTYSNCSAERGGGSPVTTGSCLFNDIDTGTNAMACDYDAFTSTPSPNCKLIHSADIVGILPGYSAAVGYDQATGLGSLNVANVVNAWTAVAPGTATATVTVTPAPTTLPISEILPVTVSVAGPKTSVTSNGTAVVPTGTVTITVGTFTSQASALSSSGSSVVLVPANSLSVGTNSISASYSGDVLYGTATGSASVTGTTAALLTPVVTVTPASSGVNSGASLSVAASVTGMGTSAPTGTVTLVGGGFSSGLETLSNGAFTFNIPANTLSNGTATLTLTYFGDANYLAGTNTATVTVGESTFTLTPTAPAAIAPGASATSTITAKAVGGYTGTVTLTCQEEADASPTTGDGASCSIPTTAVAMGATAVATVTTTAASTTASRLASPRFGGKGRGWEGAGGGAVLALLLLFGIPARRRKWQSIVGVLVLTMALGSLAACGGGGGGGGGTGGGGGGGGTTDPGTAAGTYTFTVVATGSPSVTPTVQTTFTVTVQ
jgi:subtilase family serine protease